MPRPVPDAIARAARPYLREIVALCAKSTGSPGNFVLLLGKYSSEETFLLPRSDTSQVLEHVKTEAARRKCERLLAAAHGPHDLLVLVCAGGHVEGHVVRVPTIVPEPKPDTLTEAPPCQCGCGEPAETEFQGLYYTNACFERTIDELREMGIPIEQKGNKYRLAPSTKVSFRLDGDRGKGE
jgi:hypothetical protein